MSALKAVQQWQHVATLKHTSASRSATELTFFFCPPLTPVLTSRSSYLIAHLQRRTEAISAYTCPVHCVLEVDGAVASKLVTNGEQGTACDHRSTHFICAPPPSQLALLHVACTSEATLVIHLQLGMRLKGSCGPTVHDTGV